MELNLTHESICINEVVFDSLLEQPIELDYLLPDYCQSIFKVLKCKITPKITSSRIVNDKLVIDGVACIKIIYTGEENYQIRSIIQKQMFTKSVDLKENLENPCLTVHCTCDYVNCRVVNQHRLDIRGALGIKATISVSRKFDVLSKVEGKGVQICNKKVVALGQKLYVNKEFSIKEELELSYGKPSISEVLDYEASAVLTEYKIIPNKVILKGELSLHILYAQSENLKPEIMDYTVAISQIMDVAGIGEEYQCVLNFDVISVDITAGGEDESKSFGVEFVIRAMLEADKNDEAKLINDIYSTDYEMKAVTNKVKIEQLVCIVNETCIAKSEIKISPNDIACVYDIMCDFSGSSAKFIDNSIEITGYLNTSIMAIDCDNMPIMIDRSTACTMKLDCKCGSDDMRFTPYITVASVSYNMANSEDIEIRAEIKVCGNLYRCTYYNVVNSITLDESCKKCKNDDVALRLYFAQKGEMVWDIAKTFNTSVLAIAAENNIERDEMTEFGMLLIPS